MMNKARLRFLLVFLLMLPFMLQAKDKSGRFGRMNLCDVQSDICPIDSSAKAYYLMDLGRNEFDFNRSFQINFIRHLRIKILDKEALDLADFSFVFNLDGDEADYVLRDVEGCTYNENEGELKISYLDKDDVLVEDVDEYTRKTSFSMPDVQAGSVIELQYTLSTRHMDGLLPWLFQHEIPVMRSEFLLTIPEYFSYRHYPYGELTLGLEQFSSLGTIASIRNTELSYVATVLGYNADSVPAYHLSGQRPLGDLAARVEFELRLSNIPNMLLEMVESDFRHGLPLLSVKDWYDVNQFFYQSQDLGRRLRGVERFDDLLAKLRLTTDTLANISKAYNAITAMTTWDGENSVYAQKPLNNTIESGQGNAADINLSLVALLRQMGYEAYPVVLSTLDNGFVRKYRPAPTVFNYLIAACVYQGDVVLMDATQDKVMFNELPARCQNGQGLMLMNYSYRWVDLQLPSIASEGEE